MREEVTEEFKDKVAEGFGEIETSPREVDEYQRREGTGKSGSTIKLLLQTLENVNDWQMVC